MSDLKVGDYVTWRSQRADQRGIKVRIGVVTGFNRRGDMAVVKQRGSTRHPVIYPLKRFTVVPPPESYPEHEKVKKNSHLVKILESLLEWLAEYEKPSLYSRQDLVYTFLGVDLVKLHEEKKVIAKTLSEGEETV